ncbi:MAG: hypothetical protein A2Z02_06825 [Chloroflexi bacterium RBG_16_48_7]|nr:MAG: hypothetical protein A2Z02_06825 [Chloroflexi bacterium RBG_16_48_7]
MKQIETDVVVIAGGSSGLAAAVTAAENGARVTVFEKASTTGGAANMAMGLFAVESRLQRIKQVGLTTDEAFKMFMEYTHWKGDARLIKTYIDRSASTIDWLEGLGVEFLDVYNHNPGLYYTWHVVKPSSGAFAAGSGGTLVKILTDTARELGVKVYMQTPVKKILKQNDRVTGVIAVDASGEEIKATAKAVIVATGGFGDNPEMIKERLGFEYGKDFFPHKIPGLAGDGLKMAWEAGAAQTQIIMHLVGGGPTIMTGFGFTFNQPNLAVNLLGERFMNEEEMIHNLAFCGNAISRQKDRRAYIIFDEDARRYYEDVKVDFPFVGFPVSKAENFDSELKQALDGGNENIFVFNSLDEFIAKTGVDPEGFKKTLERYNKACETGRDEEFNKKARFLRPVKKPKFYAARLFCDGFGTLGGIKINYKTEALDKESKAVPGLYACGSDANSMYGDTYCYLLSGNTLGFAINSGRMAGESATKYAKSSLN